MLKDLTRREFLQRSAGATGAFMAAKPVFLAPEAIPYPARPVAPSDRLRFGVIGLGMEGGNLLPAALSLPGVECVAVCDLYDGRHTLAKEMAGPNVRTTRRYQELLEAKDIDCLLSAVPDHWHKQIMVDAVSAGKDIYTEKPMSHDAADGVAMVAAAKKSGKIVQVGSQRVSSVICTKVKEMLAQGMIGKMNLIEGSLGRNSPFGAWEYPSPPDLSPQTLDWDTWQGDRPKRAFNKEIFSRWRCWKEYGTGAGGDLLVHLVSGMLYMTGWNEPPKKAMSLGGILRFPDGRDMPDVHATLFEYGEIPVYMRVNLGCETQEGYRFMGSKGMIETTPHEIIFTPQTGQDGDPSYFIAGWPREMYNEYQKQWHAEHDPKPGHDSPLGGFNYKGDSWDDLKPHLWRFFEAVRNRGTVTEDAVFGHHAALACHLANESYFRHSPTVWDAASQQIKTV
jgi:predicted dehydrogenase